MKKLHQAQIAGVFLASLFSAQSAMADDFVLVRNARNPTNTVTRA